MRGKVEGITIRERGARLRQIGAELTQRFHASQTGTVRPGLTLDDGTLVVTDNYMKVRIAPGLARNERVRVLIGDGDGTLTGVVKSGDLTGSPSAWRAARQAPSAPIQ